MKVKSLYLNSISFNNHIIIYQLITMITSFILFINIFYFTHKRSIGFDDLLNQIQRDIETLYEGTDPKVQRLPNYSVHVHLKKTRMNLKRLNTRLLMNSKFLDGLLSWGFRNSSRGKNYHANWSDHKPSDSAGLPTTQLSIFHK